MTTPAIDFIDEFVAAHPQVNAGAAGLPKEYVDPEDCVFEMHLPRGRAWLEIRRGNLHEVEIAWLQTEPQNQGLGDEVLGDLTARADRLGVTLKAIPKGKDERPWLVSFYERHGFVGPAIDPRTGRREGDWWRRHPRQV